MTGERIRCLRSSPPLTGENCACLRAWSDGLVAKGLNESNAPRSVGTLRILMMHQSARPFRAKQVDMHVPAGRGSVALA